MNDAIEKKETVADIGEQVDEVKNESKAERKNLLKDVFGELPEKFGTFVGDLWETIKEKLGDLKDWVMELLGMKTEDKEKVDADAEKEESERDSALKERDQNLDENTKAELQKQQKEAEAEQMKDFERLKQKGKIVPGETVELTVWSRVRNEKMKASVKITKAGLPVFGIQDKNGKMVEFSVDSLPLSATIKEIGLQNIGIDGELNMVAQRDLYIGTVELPHNVQMAKIWPVLESMAENKKDKIVIGDLTLERSKNDLPATDLVRKTKMESNGGNKAQVAPKQELPDWWEETKQNVMNKISGFGDEVGKFFNSLIDLPGQFRRYWNLRQTVNKLEANNIRIKTTTNEHDRTILVGENIIAVNKINESIKTYLANYPGEKLPSVFLVLKNRLKDQQKMVKDFDWSNVFAKGADFLGGNETEENQLLGAYEKIDVLLTEAIDPEEDLTTSLISTLESAADLFDGDLGKLKSTGKEALKQKLIAADGPTPWVGKLPEAMQDLLIDKMLDFVL